MGYKDPSFMHSIWMCIWPICEVMPHLSFVNSNLKPFGVNFPTNIKTFDNFDTCSMCQTFVFDPKFNWISTFPTSIAS